MRQKKRRACLDGPPYVTVHATCDVTRPGTGLAEGATAPAELFLPIACLEFAYSALNTAEIALPPLMSVRASKLEQT